MSDFDDFRAQHQWCRVHWKGRLREIKNLIRELQEKERRILDAIKEFSPVEDEKS